MRFVRKLLSGGPELQSRNENPPTSNVTAKKRWERFRRRSKLKDDLLNDQFGLCAYTEIRPKLHGVSWHIEHVMPKSKYPELTFDYKNLVFSVLSSEDLKGMSYSNQYAGHYKVDGMDVDLFVSCLSDGCEIFFSYLPDGRIIPNDTLDLAGKARAQYTITLLNLDCVFLRSVRRRWIEEVSAEIDLAIDEGSDMKKLEAFYLDLNVDSENEFHSATSQLFGV